MVRWVMLCGATLLFCAETRAAEGDQKGAFGIYRDTRVLNLKVKTKNSGNSYTLDAPPSPHQYLSVYTIETDKAGHVCDIVAIGFVTSENAYVIGSTIRKQMEESYGKGRGIGEEGKVIFYSNNYVTATASSQNIAGRAAVFISMQLKPRIGCADEPKIPTNSFN